MDATAPHARVTSVYLALPMLLALALACAPALPDRPEADHGLPTLPEQGAPDQGGWPDATLLELGSPPDLEVAADLGRTDPPADASAPPDLLPHTDLQPLTDLTSLADRGPDLPFSPDLAPPPDQGPPDLGPLGPPRTVRGYAYDFSPTGGMLAGGRVTVAELPGWAAITDADGQWTLAVPGNREVSFVFEHPGHVTTQTATFPPDLEELTGVAFQVPGQAMFDLLQRIVATDVAPDRCQLASTVTRRPDGGYVGTPGTHGEPGATVTLDPPLPAAHGPIYFNLLQGNLIWPDRQLTETTDDGGVLFLNLPPGDYRLTASKPGAVIRSLLVRCRAGLLINASPPWGLQVLEGGAEAR